MALPIVGSLDKVIFDDNNVYDWDLKQYSYVISCASNNAAGYHNLRHMTHVTVMCYSALIYYKEIGQQINPRNARCLMVAAMFHDYDHTGHKGNDHVNITRAIKGFQKRMLPVDRDCQEEIEELISWTEYPYKLPTDKIPLLARILRDADQSQSLSTAWIQQVLVGLAYERDLRPIDMLREHIKFLDNLTFATDWAKWMFDSQMEAKKLEARRLLVAWEEYEADGL